MTVKLNEQPIKGFRFSVSLREDEFGTLTIDKVKKGFDHTYQDGAHTYNRATRSPLGVRSPKTESMMRGWLKTCVAKTIVEDGLPFDAKEIIGGVWSDLKQQVWEKYDELNALPIAEIERLYAMIRELKIVKQIDEESNYPIVLKVEWDDEEHELNLNDKTIFSLGAIRSAFLRTFHRVPTALFDISAEDWGMRIINRLHEANRVKEEEAEESTEKYICQLIVSEIYRSRPVTDPKEAVIPGTYLWIEEIIWLPNLRIREILRAENVNINLRRVKQWTKHLNAGRSRQFRVGEEVMRFWPFSLEKLGLTAEKIEKAKEQG